MILDEIRNLDFEIKLIDNGVARNVNDESVQISMEGPNNYQVSLDETSDVIGLVPGNYIVSSFVTKEDKIKIEKQTLHECTSVPRKGLLGLIFKEEKCVDIDVGGFDLDNVIIGGNNFEFNVDKEELNSRKIIFYLNVYDTPETQEEISELYEKINAGGIVNNFRYPEYEN